MWSKYKGYNQHTTTILGTIFGWFQSVYVNKDNNVMYCLGNGSGRMMARHNVGGYLKTSVQNAEATGV